MSEDAELDGDAESGVTTPSWPVDDDVAGRLWYAAQQAATATGLGLAVVTPVGVHMHTIAINDLGVEILGRPRDEIVAQPSLPFVAPEDVARMRDQHDAMLRGGVAPTRFETTIVRSNGNRAPIEVTFGRLTVQGRPHFIVFLSDISQRKAIEARLARTDRLAALGMLAAGVAHEVNNPLAFVALNADLLRREMQRLVPDAAQRARADALLAELDVGIERVAVIARDLKTFARSDDTELAAVDLAPVIDSAERLMGPELRERATIVREIATVPAVVGATGRLEQVLVNLLINAAHALPEGRAGNEIRVRLSAPGDRWVHLDVIDNGRGIAPEDLPHVFDPFFTTKPAGLGTGLGLLVCQAIVTRLGGEIGLESVQGHGTTAHVRLRVAPT